MSLKFYFTRQETDTDVNLHPENGQKKLKMMVEFCYSRNVLLIGPATQCLLMSVN